MEIKKTSLPGCFVIIPDRYDDNRGRFVKTFASGIFHDNNLITSFEEEFFTVSKKRVLRGMHVQTPPHQLTKIVYCTNGKIFDVVIDLRIGSPSYNGFETFELSSENHHILYIPEGVAHGFYAMTHNAVTAYKTTCGHSAENDTGILWKSAGIPWPDKDPILSARDIKLPPLKEFKSPFKYLGKTS
jgi:dTDP-4-dehydrorhamnose 3,5-epimerase